MLSIRKPFWLFLFSLAFTTLSCAIGLPTPPPNSPLPTPAFPAFPTDQPPAPPGAPADTSQQSGSFYFDPSAVNQTAPADILNEVTFYSGGGSGDMCPDERRSYLNILNSALQVEWLGRMELIACGWQPTELILISVFHEGVFSQQASTTADSNGMVVYNFIVTEAMQTGNWVIKIDGSSGHLETTINVFMPSAPRMYRVSDTRLILYGFAPNEVIRLVAYQLNPPSATGDMTSKIGDLAGWTERMVDSSGKLVVDIPGNNLLRYYAVSASTGAVYEIGPDPRDFKANMSILNSPHP